MIDLTPRPILRVILARRSIALCRRPVPYVNQKWLRKLDRGIGDGGSGSAKLDSGMSDGSALCGDDSAADERSREHETTTTEPLSGVQGQGGAGSDQG